ncbi:MAG: DMT family transporter [Myxococcota bacterium]
MSAPAPPRVALVLVAALIGVSAAGTLVRLAPDAHPLAVAFWRTAAVAALLSPTLVRVSRRDLGLVALAGLLLAAHFWAWITSLHHTSVMRSTVLVCLTPVWAGVLEAAFFGAHPPRRFWGGVAVALGGIALMSGEIGDADLMGDGLATLGGTLSAAYLVVGRSVRQRVAIGPYGALVCGACALWLLLPIVAGGVPLTGFSRQTWYVLAALALGPQLLGHVGFNYAVGYVPAAVVSAVILLEPVGATLLAAAVLGEIPSPREVSGGVVVLLGVAVATRRG